MKDQSEKREVLNVTMSVTEEIYKNPKFEAPKQNENEAPAQGFHSIDMMEDYQPEYLKKSHFEIKGTVDGLNIRAFAHNILRSARGMAM